MRFTAKILAVATVSTIGLTFGLSSNALAQRNVAKFDTNKDGVVSIAEFKAGEAKRIEKKFSKMDVNADGVLDQEEIAAHKIRQEKRRQKNKG